MKKLAIYIPSIESGGVEKNLYYISEYFLKKKIEVYIITANYQKKISWDRLGSTSAQNIKGSIDIYNLTAADGSSLERLYISMYCSETSSKLPEGF